ncbi:hypothetical protein INR76_13120 [Marixanthomonas sp. SCSIO 43207]|uniref:DUF7935 family protein n=1 Tax=Marixanthomonas sp. SCSIO 43207 TaxID=2779360 RepID=UPI001CA83EE6|nr:hypothetical protein [Marixanthomonas sp. SCSIO 43207]UAB81031.1 hypothetical protein INR76_13120 [Marixanthomonas sp. SCSIO 43207]
MEFTPVLNYVAYLLPAIVVGIIAYYFFKGHTANEEGRRRFLIQKEAQNKVLPTRLQAYERLTLLLERIDPNKLLIRVKPTSSEIEKYEELLIKNIEQEFDHNVTQQIYVSVECWNLIQTAKNATIHIIRQVAMHEQKNTADAMREAVLRHFMEEITPSQKALTYIKKEVSELY